MPADLELDTLRLLTALVEAGSLTAAARLQGISQPAASARIREFEARWQLSVVRRSSRGATLTTDGQAVVAWARDVLGSVDTMRASMEALSQSRSANLHIAASLTLAEHLVPRWLGELHATRPATRPVLQVVNSESVADAVRSGAAEIGFVESTSLPAGLASRTVGRDRLVVVVARTHPWARRRIELDQAELTAARWVLREPGSGTRSTFEAALGDQPQVALEATSTTALLGAVMAGVGPAVVSELSIRGELETGRLVSVPHRLDLRRPLTGVWRADQRLSEPARDLLAIAVR
ncbi:LysR family transcriptional regulator [Terrabacter sp. NPDC080008]|uniref:LysR family transcriptional regulator n=1 Tax=Terrabacter sp. NPDC080008 TaxID=3155176 RepID=UPI00344B440B